MFKSGRSALFILSIFLIFCGSTEILGQTPRATFVNVTPNRLAPEFYGQDLSIKNTLINLPGADVAGSTWTLSYDIYFLPEGHKKEIAMAKNGRLGSDITPTDFPKRILLNKDTFMRKSLGTLRDRTSLSDKFKFGSRIPSSQQMEGADLVTFYTVKVYDARLKKTVVKSGAFFGRVFAGDKQRREKIYLNFFVSASGELFVSQSEKEDDSTEWSAR